MIPDLDPWRVVAGDALVLVHRDLAVLVDLSSLAAADDLVDLLTAAQAPDGVETVGFELERDRGLRAGVLQRLEGATRVLASGLAVFEANEPVAVTPGVAVEMGPDVRMQTNRSAGAGWVAPAAPLVGASGVATMAPVPKNWWDGSQLRTAGPPDTWGEPHPRRVDSALGVLCPNGHLNNPSALTCMVDGCALVTSTQQLVEGPRPVFASLVLSDGSPWPLVRDVLLGRSPAEPELPPGVDGISLSDDSFTMSRRHARVRLDGWSVFLSDVGSRHGTYRQGADETTWELIPPNQEVELGPGDTISLAGHRVRFIRHDITSGGT